ncbi:hypothetical protein EV175_006492, partial [Coemansia sp. RSA 1933]
MKERERQARQHAKVNVKSNIASLLNLSKPTSRKSMTEAGRIVDWIMENLERAFEDFDANDSYKNTTSAGLDSLKSFNGSFNLQRTKRSVYLLGKLNEPELSSASERMMYSMFSDFALLVAHYTRQAKAVRKYSPARVLLPCERFDFIPEGNDDIKRIDLALVIGDAQGDIHTSDELHYDEVFAMVELKRSKCDTNAAYAQLIDYMHNVYPNQHDRRFTWGIT